MTKMNRTSEKSMEYGVQDYYANNRTDETLIGFFNMESSIYPYFPGIRISVSVDRNLPLMSLNIFGMPLLYQILDALRDQVYHKAICGDPYHTLELRLVANDKWWITITTIVDMNDDPSYMDKNFYSQPDQDYVRWESGHTPLEKLRRVSISLRLSQARIGQLVALLEEKVSDANSSSFTPVTINP